jgi:superfamily II DNA or RNA helicase
MSVTATARTAALDALFKANFSKLPLRADHERRPLWVCPNRRVFLESWSPVYKQAYDFLIAISDPVTRPQYIHEYVITEYSLYAAASLGLDTQDILRGLRKMSKTEIDPEVIRFITRNTERCGKVKLVLKNRRYYVESFDPDVLKQLLASSEIAASRCDNKPRKKAPAVAANASAATTVPSGATAADAAAAAAAAVDWSYSKRTSMLPTAGDDADAASAGLPDTDPITGFLITKIDTADEGIYLQGTGDLLSSSSAGADGSGYPGSISAATGAGTGASGKRVNRRIDQRAAMGIRDSDDDSDDDDEGGSSSVAAASTAGAAGAKPASLAAKAAAVRRVRRALDDDDDEDDSDDGGAAAKKQDQVDEEDDDGGALMTGAQLAKRRKLKQEAAAAASAAAAATIVGGGEGGDVQLKPEPGTGAAAASAGADAGPVKPTLAPTHTAAPAAPTAPAPVRRPERVTAATAEHVYAFEIDPASVEAVRRLSNSLGYPMLEEYDFRAEGPTPASALPVELRPSAQIREYQEKALSKMFGNGRARSGIIVLPCGAGKTLVGITAMATLARSTLIFCSTGVAVEQWRRQIKLWTNLPDERVVTFTRENKAAFPTGPKVVITTYSMMAYEQQRSRAAKAVMDMITQEEWGLVLLDEVHVAPADKFSKCVRVTHSRCKLGLTATLVREDSKIEDLYFMLGPKLYEANWMDLSAQGFIATVMCREVWCPMTPSFFKEYLSTQHHHQLLLATVNPAKFHAMEALIRVHEARGDKIMVFSDNVCALELFAIKLGRPFIHGGVKDAERVEIFRCFSTRDDLNTIFISKVGDNSIDLPDTNVIIQISAHFGSRRQEAQRMGTLHTAHSCLLFPPVIVSLSHTLFSCCWYFILNVGRILRPKSHKSGNVDAYFYTLVSSDTKEVMYATKRQRFLVDQGYAYEVMLKSELDHALKDAIAKRPLGYTARRDQEELLAQTRVLSGRGEAALFETFDRDTVFDDREARRSGRGALPGGEEEGEGAVSLAALSGAGGRVYKEYS